MKAGWSALLVLVAGTAMSGTTIPVVNPVASVWYRGVPAGTPRADDLAAIRALGFTGVTWPLMYTHNAGDLRRMASEVGLAVVIRLESKPLTPTWALKPGDEIDVPVSRIAPAAIPPLVWRAIAHGATVVSFDPGQLNGTGLFDAGSHQQPWVPPALAITTQLTVNAQLVRNLRQAPDLTIDAPKPASLDVVLRQDARSWVLIATNTAPDRVRAVVHLPAGVPAALWVNLIDSGMMSMLNQPQGPRWSLDLPGHTASVYVINKSAGGDAEK